MQSSFHYEDVIYSGVMRNLSSAWRIDWSSGQAMQCDCWNRSLSIPMEERTDFSRVQKGSHRRMSQIAPNCGTSHSEQSGWFLHLLRDELVRAILCFVGPVRYQSWYQCYESCRLYYIFWKCLSALDDDNICCIAKTDVAKAFDFVPRSQVLDDAHHLGVYGTSIVLLKKLPEWNVKCCYLIKIKLSVIRPTRV